MTSLFEDHLSLDAVVAFADGEMSLIAFQRAAAHVAQCQDCATEVAEQTSARQQLRSAACPSIPTGLLDALRSIPVALPATPPPGGVSRDATTGRATRSAPITADRADLHQRPGAGSRGHSSRGRGFRLGAGAIVAGLAVGAIAAAAIAERSDPPAHPSTTPDAAQVSFPLTSPSTSADVVAALSTR